MRSVDVKVLSLRCQGQVKPTAHTRQSWSDSGILFYSESKSRRSQAAGLKAQRRTGRCRFLPHFTTKRHEVTQAERRTISQCLHWVADTSSLSILLRQSRRQKARKTHRMWMSSDNKESRGSQEKLSAAVCEPVSGRQRKSLGIQRPWPSGKSVK